jgi:hypothetical protein
MMPSLVAITIAGTRIVLYRSVTFRFTPEHARDSYIQIVFTPTVVYVNIVRQASPPSYPCRPADEGSGAHNPQYEGHPRSRLPDKPHELGSEDSVGDWEEKKMGASGSIDVVV